MKPIFTFLAALLLAPLAALHAADPKPAPAKAPFRVLYSDDTTHTLVCVSPYHKGKPLELEAPATAEGRTPPFGPQMIEGAVDETAGTGIEVHMLQPGFGYVPWWKSRVYPFSDHMKFMQERFGSPMPKGGWAEYMATGGDMVGVFTKRCREKKLAPFVSLRMNDCHGHEMLLGPKGPRNETAWATLAPLHVEHPEWRLGSDVSKWSDRHLNWNVPQVREYKLRLIEEICRQYPLAGFELDFMRFPKFFDVKETTREQRVAIMREFIGQVRGILDRTAPSGQRRWLCVRVPAFLASHDAMGIDLAAWVRAGVDMVNLSYFYFAAQGGDLAAIRALVPDAAVYVEMCHTTRVGPVVGAKGGYDNFSYRRTTPAQFYTTAHVAYARGLDGVSAFNFVYYREHGTGERGPFCEPPFEVFKHLGDRAWVARQPQHYFVGEVWSVAAAVHPLPKTFRTGDTHRVTLDMAPPSGGWTKPGRLRIQSPEDLGNRRWSCRFNGQELAETPDRSEPYANPYPALLGGLEHHRAWLMPPGLPKDGANQIELSLQEGSPAKIVFLDLAMP
ncbi:MAG: hypothetical protein HZC54_07845 [Verrucomicrobia bacterium]|nr:hypothetical protein [Verrucomicrobiota bacterium]